MIVFIESYGYFWWDLKMIPASWKSLNFRFQDTILRCFFLTRMCVSSNSSMKKLMNDLNLSGQETPNTIVCLEERIISDYLHSVAFKYQTSNQIKRISVQTNVYFHC